jgi:hypothetical protein
VILPVTSEWDVPLGVLRGYASESFALRVAESVNSALQRGKRCVYPYHTIDRRSLAADQRVRREP